MIIIEISTPDLTLTTTGDFVVLPLTDGEIGIGYGHEDFIGQVKKGQMRITYNGEKTKYRISDGFVKAKGNLISVSVMKMEKE